MKKDEKNLSRWMTEYTVYSSLFVQMFVITGLGFGAGKALDSFLGVKKPTWTVILTVLAAFLSIYLLIRKLVNTPKK